MTYEKNNWLELITAMRSGAKIEITEEVYYYFLGVLPPVFVNKYVDFMPGYEGHRMFVNFGFAEGMEKIVLFWHNDQQEKFYCQQSNKVNEL